MLLRSIFRGISTGRRVLPRQISDRRESTMRKPIRTLTLLLAIIALPVVALAQSVSTAGQIQGRITDDTGDPVAGVSVTARNVETGLQRETRTQDDGTYIIRLLPPGTYAVTARSIGFRPETSTGVRVVLGSSSPVNFGLTRAAVELEAIEIVAQAEQIDVSEGGVKQLVTQQEIEDLPSLGRDFVDFINLSGLVAPDPGETTGGQFAIAGARPSQTSVQIDGVDANNSFFGENRGGSRIPFTFSLESIREFQIITNGFDVEFGRFSGGIINVVTRGGTNEFEGTVSAHFRDDALTSSPFIDDPTNPEITTDYEVQQFSARLSGPIVRDKAHFLVSVDGQRRREPQLPLTRNRFSPNGEQPNPDTFDEFGQYLDALENIYGVNNAASGYQPFSTSNDEIVVFGRIDWNINQDHRLSIRHNFADFDNDNEWNGVFDREYGLSRAELLEDQSNSTMGELTSVFGENTFNVLRVQYSFEKRPRQGKDLRPTLTVNLAGGQQVRYGGTFASFNNNLEETKLEVINNLTQVVGRHTFKIGGNFLLTNFFNQFMNFGSQFQGAGEFRFANLEDFIAGRPSSYFRPIQEEDPTRPGELRVPQSDFDVIDWAAYIQDTWQLTPKLSATIGLRYEQKSFRDSPRPVVDVERAFGFETGFAPTDKNNFSPRFNFVYDANADGRTVVRGGIGYFYGPLPGVVAGNVLQTELPVLEVICNGSILDGDPDAPPDPLNVNGGYGSWAIDGSDNPESCAQAGAAGVPTYTFWQQDFAMPEFLKANLGFETMLGDRTQVGVNFIFSQGTNLYTVRNLNLRESQFNLATEGGRRVFSPAGQFDPTGSNSTSARRNLEFGDVLVNFNDGRSRSYTLELSGSHRFSPGAWIQGSYTFNKAYDNSPYSCCTAGGGYADPTTGEFGPNEIGDFGDTERAWGISDFSREHTLVAAMFFELPLDFQLSTFWKSQSGRPWTVAGDDDLNGDGLTGNDRAFIFTPENLPLASTGTDADEERALYASILSENSCVGDFQGQIIERNTCRMPWRHQLDVRVTKGFNMPFGGQRAEFQVDFFNVLNGIGRLFCDEADPDTDLTSGICGLGRVTGVFGSNTELLEPAGFEADPADPSQGRILYEVESQFAQEDLLGANLVLQFQLQLAFRYFF